MPNENPNNPQQKQYEGFYPELNNTEDREFEYQDTTEGFRESLNQFGINLQNSGEYAIATGARLINSIVSIVKK